MHKLYWLGGMILLFLLLANVVLGVGAGDLEQPRMEQPPGHSFDASRNRGDGDGGPVLEPELARRLAVADADELVRVVVRLDPPATRGLRGVAWAEDGRADVEARARLVSSLQEAAERSQGPVRAYLERERARGNVSSYEPLWITNGIAVEARAAVVPALAGQASVATVEVDRWRRWVDGDTWWTEGERETAGDVEWNVERIRADEVWSSLAISGTGAVVAGMDTGVDWLHPALEANYRGYSPHGAPNHATSWYDATGGGALYPVDGHGHGSHTLGTAVGRGGIGVAPGARWIGVRVLNSQGYGYDSWIHAGFQWLLAPGGDAARAPDVVNCSWGSSGSLTTFQDDVTVLRAAGILPVFSNGNDGPEKGTVSSPASLSGAFAVGAADPYDAVATFSSRGPSPWGEVRPHVVAPGVHVRSSVPGGAYATMKGTSMAAPHVSGVAALLRSASETVSVKDATHAITSTAVALGETVPNNDCGWGRVDALASVTALVHPGWISGTVRDGASDEPIGGARVAAVSRGEETMGKTRSDEEGKYALALSPGMYDVSVSAFGYDPATVHGVRVLTDGVTTEDVWLAAQPRGRLTVRVVEASTGGPVAATVTVVNTPHEVTTHTHTFDLPDGSYEVRARQLGYRVVTSTAVVSAGETSSTVLSLPEAPSLLVVDSGGWYYESEVGTFHEALDDLQLAYDDWAIRRLPEDVPRVSSLAPYDIVVWSAPRDAPGYIGAGDVITGYLEGGGRLLLSGQDVGLWDGGGAGTSWSPYYRDYLKAKFVDDNAPTRVVEGVADDIFSGAAITISGAGGADNQDYPDVVSVADTDGAAPVLAYRDDGCAGIRVGTCLDYRVVYLAFGFEGINDRVARRELMGDALEWLSAPAPTAGLTVEPRSQLRIGSPGSLITHTVRVRHVGQGGGEDEVDLTVEGASWPTELSQSSLTLAPCMSETVTVSVTIPAGVGWDVRDVVTLTAGSALSPSLRVSATLSSKVPAPVLLVDDDRWYDQQETYRGAMDQAGFVYDVWETATAGGGHGPGPGLGTLKEYPVVVWWTGYDWYAPVTADEMSCLAGYLEAGGRLFLSSQDFLYYHGEDPFSRRHLGVLTYTEEITPTKAVGVTGNPVGGGLGPWPLEYPAGYQNWSDGVTPAPGTGVAFRDQGERGIALTHRRGAEAAVFLPFPFEALPGDRQPAAMEAGVGWLSWLGQTTFEAVPRSAAAGDWISYTIRVRNDGREAVTAVVSNTVPAGMTVDGDSVAGPGWYDASERRIRWRGMVEGGEGVIIGYRARVSEEAAAGEVIVNRADIRAEEHTIAFGRSADVGIERADLSPSTFDCTPTDVRPGGVATCTLRLVNAGTAGADAVRAEVKLPGGLKPALNSVSSRAGEGEWGATEGGMTWTGPLPAGAEAVLTFSLDMPAEPVRRTVYGVAFVDDGAGERWERPTWLEVRPWEQRFPLLMKQGQ